MQHLRILKQHQMLVKSMESRNRVLTHLVSVLKEKTESHVSDYRSVYMHSLLCVAAKVYSVY